MSRPSEHVLDLFAVPAAVQQVPAGPGPGPGPGRARGRSRSVLAGDLVLTPDRDRATHDWLSPLLARLAVGLDQNPSRRRQDLRVAMPVPARDGSWVVEGWAASRYEPGTVTCGDPHVVRAAGHVLHARLASAVTERPVGLDVRTDSWAVAERVAFGEAPLPDLDGGGVGGIVARALEAAGREALTGPGQLVHADLPGNVLLDAAGAPVVIDVRPAWRPVMWADAVCALDSVVRYGAPVEALESWAAGPARGAMLRAVAFRLLSDPGTADGDACSGVLSRII